MKIGKDTIKKFLGIKTYWPKSVFDSLLVWLQKISGEWSFEYNVNPSQKNIHDTVWVLWWKDALEYALYLKKKWFIKKIIAWPNITSPTNKDDIFFDKLIDTIVVPSQRIADLFVSLNPSVVGRLAIWPAWTPDEYTHIHNSSSKYDILLYKKDAPEYLLTAVESILNKKKLSYKILEYWTFTRDAYLHLLTSVRGEIYLQTTETQGMALQEARMMNVPTFVWNRGYFKNKYLFWADSKISAPYLDEANWMFFYSLGDFESKLEKFLMNIDNHIYKPRDFYLANLSDIEAAKLFLNVFWQ